MNKPILKVENISKRYRYGQIGSTTLRDELHRWNAKLHSREDPTKKIGDDDLPAGESFLALDGITFDVEKGERVGIIGQNGAGKSTLLKLISRITAPSAGDIWLDGRVTSLLEVGTGFNSELTGRENIYLKGAIMGMRKKEIDSIIEEIIDFSECREFIETPIKRYSSGMQVKLAFSVAAHLESEIIIMDEVLAVGDIAFQQKCLKKMEEVSVTKERTILYVSHNMNTIRQLCDRCIVLDKGRMIFDGDVEEAISIYLGNRINKENYVDLRSMRRRPEAFSLASPVRMTSMCCYGSESNVLPLGGEMEIALSCESKAFLENVHLRIIIKDPVGRPIAMMTTDKGFSLRPGAEETFRFSLDVSYLAPGSYTVNNVLYQVDDLGNDVKLDVLDDIYGFDIVQISDFNNNMTWRRQSWGYLYGKPLDLERITTDKDLTDKE